MMTFPKRFILAGVRGLFQAEMLTMILFITLPIIAQEDCNYQEWQQYQDTTLYHHQDKDAYFYVTDHIGIDADGAPNAYHPNDVGFSCMGTHPFKGLDCPANAGYPKSTWWQNVLVADPKDKSKAYVQDSGQFAGYFVSKTAFRDASKPETDPETYVDATLIPYIVLPYQFLKMQDIGAIGNFGYAVNLDTGAKSPFLIADVGPTNAPLGEVSIALATALGGENPNPRTGSGVPQATFLFFIFPHSTQRQEWPLTPEAIKAQADHLVESVGGLNAAINCHRTHGSN